MLLHHSPLLEKELILKFDFKILPQSFGCPTIPFYPFIFNNTIETNMLLIILFSLMINIAEQILIYNLFCQSVAHEANATNKSAYSLIDPRFHLRKFVVALSL